MADTSAPHRPCSRSPRRGFGSTSTSGCRAKHVNVAGRSNGGAVQHDRHPARSEPCPVRGRRARPGRVVAVQPRVERARVDRPMSSSYARARIVPEAAVPWALKRCSRERMALPLSRRPEREGQRMPTELGGRDDTSQQPAIPTYPGGGCQLIPLRSASRAGRIQFTHRLTAGVSCVCLGSETCWAAKSLGGSDSTRVFGART